VPVDATLKTAFSTMLQLEAGWVAVLDGDRFCGVLTPTSLHAALRRSVEGVEPETAGAAL
jgi:osmoprotectant transport system ATP-binding protein